MASIMKRSLQAWPYLKGVIISDAHEPFGNGTYILGTVVGFEAGLSPPPLLLVDVLAVTFLDAS